MITGYRARLAAVLVPLFILTACAEEAPLPPPDSRPVKTLLVGGEIAGNFRQFPGVVDAIQRADLSFRIQGKIIKILVREGDSVEKDQVLAKLDPTDYQIVLNDREASYKTAQANYDRAKQLLKKEAISKVDHDKIRAEYFTAQANLKAARQDMIYTSLKATFPGYVAQRHVENFEEVRRKQTVFTLQDISELEINLDVPENIMIQLRRATETGRKREVYAVFDRIKGAKFPLSMKEVSTRADPNTRTFQVTMKMDYPEGYNVQPGMTATVFAEVFPSERDDTLSVLLPVSAVISDTGKNPIVWIVDEETMTVSAKPVTVGQMANDSITVFGIEPGQRVVTAGAAFMREGIKVTLLETGEQPGDQP